MNFFYVFRLLALAGGIVFIWSSCNKVEDATKDSNRGSLVERTLLGTYAPKQADSLMAVLTGTGLASLFPSKYSIEVYRVIYNTPDPFNKMTKASGLVIVPKGQTKAVPLVSYQHGTITKKTDAPSNMTSSEIGIGLIMSASGGFTVSMPDYLGFGTTAGLYSGIHPYIHSATEASTSIDMMRATRNSLKDNTTVTLSDQVFLVGYSQGGHATMATLKEIEEKYSDEFKIEAAAPMAGPYDLSRTQAETIIAPEPFSAPYFLPQLLLAYNDIYKLYGPTSQFLKAPYNLTLPPLFNGNTSASDITSVMPSVPRDIIEANAYGDFVNNFYSNPLRNALRENDLIAWTPKSVVKMYHCQADKLVPYKNSTVALESFKQRGASQVSLVDVGNMSHTGCAPFALIACYNWFLTLKR
jgi:pimeloyl-ACP methyl ester carboxylesterase